MRYPAVDGGRGEGPQSRLLLSWKLPTAPERVKRDYWLVSMNPLFWLTTRREERNTVVCADGGGS
jgi:hypothetical protein